MVRWLQDATPDDTELDDEVATPESDEATPEAGASPAPSPFENEIDVLNFALTYELLDSTLYRQGLEEFDEQAFIDAGYQPVVRENIAQIVANEEAQIATLTQVITDLGGEPVEPAEYDFPYTDFESWLALSREVENVGVDAYTGAAQYLIDNDELLTAALTIHGVEARQAAYFNLLVGESPFPDAFDAPLTPEEVLEFASQFIVS